MPDVLCVLNSTPTRSSIVPRGDQLRTPFSGCSVTAYRRAGCADRPSRAPSIARPAPHGKGIIIASCVTPSMSRLSQTSTPNFAGINTEFTVTDLYVRFPLHSASTLRGNPPVESPSLSPGWLGRVGRDDKRRLRRPDWPVSYRVSSSRPATTSQTVCSWVTRGSGGG